MNEPNPSAESNDVSNRILQKMEPKKTTSIYREEKIKSSKKQSKIADSLHVDWSQGQLPLKLDLKKNKNSFNDSDVEEIK